MFVAKEQNSDVHPLVAKIRLEATAAESCPVPGALTRVTLTLGQNGTQGRGQKEDIFRNAEAQKVCLPEIL